MPPLATLYCSRPTGLHVLCWPLCLGDSAAECMCTARALCVFVIVVLICSACRNFSPSRSHAGRPSRSVPSMGLAPDVEPHDVGNLSDSSAYSLVSPAVGFSLGLLTSSWHTVCCQITGGMPPEGTPGDTLQGTPQGPHPYPQIPRAHPWVGL